MDFFWIFLTIFLVSRTSIWSQISARERSSSKIRPWKQTVIPLVTPLEIGTSLVTDREKNCMTFFGRDKRLFTGRNGHLFDRYAWPPIRKLLAVFLSRPGRLSGSRKGWKVQINYDKTDLRRGQPSHPWYRIKIIIFNKQIYCGNKNLLSTGI